MADNKWPDGSVSGRYQSNGLKQVIWPSLPGEVNTKTTRVRLQGEGSTVLWLSRAAKMRAVR
jgi:hypothetical protein